MHGDAKGRHPVGVPPGVVHPIGKADESAKVAATGDAMDLESHVVRSGYTFTGLRVV
jgi:hypothetical protein